MYLRIYTGKDGQAHFEEITLPTGPRGISAPQDAKSVVFMTLAPGFQEDFHNARQPSIFINISGKGEIGVGSGETRMVGPGDIVLCEDTTGQGHKMKVVGDKPRVMAYIALAGK
jgi:quercetin dioxygenase-like cupin family protein